MMYDAVIIGSGFGGMSTALHLAESGAHVLLLEAVNYPGGCASTFERNGYRFESGATLFSGFGEGQLFNSWMKNHNLPVTFEAINPLIRFKSNETELLIKNDRKELIEQFKNLPNAPKSNLDSFFRLQQNIADILWPIFDDPYRLPPFSTDGILWHIKRSFRYPTLLGLMGKTLKHVLERHKLFNFTPLVDYCNALSQITLQTSIEDVEALFALSALDYPFRGTGHIQGGIGELGHALCSAICNLGSDVWFSSRAKRLTREQDHWIIETRKQSVKSKHVVANLLPQDLLELAPNESLENIKPIGEAVSQGWGAVMLYLVLEDHPSFPAHAHHLQAVRNRDLPFIEGNHLFCSIGARGEQHNSNRTATVSTHVPIKSLYNQSKEQQAKYINSIQKKLKDNLTEQFPILCGTIKDILPASPRTFQRFTRRKQGMVGGIPKQVGLHNYTNLWPVQPTPNLWMVGDSYFPGQSTLATAVGGVRTAHAILNKMGLYRTSSAQIEG